MTLLTVAEARRVESRVDWKHRTATHLYRLYDGQDRLLYVGVTIRSLGERFTAHASSKPWWGEVVGVHLEWFSHNAAALEAERAAIRTERPTHNIRSASLTASSVSPAARLHEVAQ